MYIAYWSCRFYKFQFAHIRAEIISLCEERASGARTEKLFINPSASSTRKFIGTREVTFLILGEFGKLLSRRRRALLFYERRVTENDDDLGLIHHDSCASFPPLLQSTVWQGNFQNTPRAVHPQPARYIESKRICTSSYKLKKSIRWRYVTHQFS